MLRSSVFVCVCVGQWGGWVYGKRGKVMPENVFIEES